MPVRVKTRLPAAAVEPGQNKQCLTNMLLYRHYRIEGFTLILGLIEVNMVLYEYLDIIANIKLPKILLI